MIAVDAMGGDFAPQAPVCGAFRAAKRGVPVTLFGSRVLVEELLHSIDPNWKDYPITLIDTSTVIGMADEPVAAVRSKKDSSLVQAVASVKAGQSSAVISAGNSGALMAAATFVLGRKQGIERPAIAGWLPALKGRVLTLDLGANADCKPSYLHQFSLIGIDYLKQLKPDISNPRVGLLSNGEEDGKGSELVKQAFELLNSDDRINFVGNVEPSHIVSNKADIVVADGFSGNVLLKAMEATATLSRFTFEKCVTQFLSEHESFSDREKDAVKGLAKKVEEAVVKLTHSPELGGANLLGVNGHVLVAHGSADEFVLENGIRMVFNQVSQKS